MKQLMPSRGKGLNRFSGLTISKPPSAGPSAMETSVSGSDSGGGSTGTTGAPSTVQDTVCMVPPSHTVQGGTEGGSVRGANARFTAIDTDADDGLHSAAVPAIGQSNRPSPLCALIFRYSRQLHCSFISCIVCRFYQAPLHNFRLYQHDL